MERAEFEPAPFVLASAGPTGLNVRCAHVSLRRNRYAIFRAFLELCVPIRFAGIAQVSIPLISGHFWNNYKGEGHDTYWGLNPFVFRAFLERLVGVMEGADARLNPFVFRAFLERKSKPERKKSSSLNPFVFRAFLELPGYVELCRVYPVSIPLFSGHFWNTMQRGNIPERITSQSLCFQGISGTHELAGILASQSKSQSLCFQGISGTGESHGKP